MKRQEQNKQEENGERMVAVEKKVRGGEEGRWMDGFCLLAEFCMKRVNVCAYR